LAERHPPEKLPNPGPDTGDPTHIINAEPGALLKGRVREFCRTWKNQSEATVQGRHFIQEDSGPEIGRHIKAWLQAFSQN
jgi:haloalkane dehalogenase